MAYEFDEKRRRAQRQKLAQQRQRRYQRQQQLLRWVTFGAIAAVGIVMLSVLLSRNARQDTPAAETDTTQSTTAPVQTTAPTSPETTIELVFGGDVNITDKVIAAGESSGKYDYTQLLLDVAPVLAQADAAFLNLEGGFYGPPYTGAAASAPQALADALADAGVDMVQLANSRTIYNGLTGLSSTITAVRSAGMTALGVFASDQEREESQGFTLVNIRGVRVAIVAFTKGMDGMSLPTGRESCVNLLYKDYASTYQAVDTEGITAVLTAAQAQQPDITIALVHWGSEYNDNISPSQTEIVQLMQGLGVDAIVGTHSHFVQQVQYDPEQGTVVAYSLGDLLGDGEKGGTNYSILLQLQITKDNTTGQTRITGCDYTGVYLLTPEKDGHPLQPVRIESAMELYENAHISSVSKKAYDNICAAWARIQARTAG